MVEPRTKPPTPGRRRRAAASRSAPAPAPQNADREQRAPVPPAVVDLLAHLGVLRTTLEEVLARVRSRLVARLERLERAASNPALPLSLADDLCAEIARAGVSSKKGRVRDLVRMKDLLDELCEELDREQQP
ncbi:MAG: hypothetical protein AB2L07_18185 [Thermoanaerobaculaceae bacterium]